MNALQKRELELFQAFLHPSRGLFTVSVSSLVIC